MSTDIQTVPAPGLPGRLVGKVRRRLLRHLLGTITGVRTAEPVVALTFDDGPDPDVTPPLLDLLARFDARATFFVLGQNVRQNPGLLHRIAREGHCVGNHGYTHRALPTLGSAERRSEFLLARGVAGPSMSRFVRPPCGLMDLGTRLDFAAMGGRPVTWNVHAEDWAARSPEWMAGALADRVAPGSIVLLHDRLEGAAPDAAPRADMLRGLELFLEGAGRAFRFVTVPELLRHGRAVRANWLIRDDADWPRAVREF